jgi:chromosome segregation ATPase
MIKQSWIGLDSVEEYKAKGNKQSKDQPSEQDKDKDKDNKVTDQIQELKDEVIRREQVIEEQKKKIEELTQIVRRLTTENKRYRGNFQNTVNQLVEFSAGMLRTCVDTPDITQDEKVINIIRGGQ